MKSKFVLHLKFILELHLTFERVYGTRMSKCTRWKFYNLVDTSWGKETHKRLVLFIERPLTNMDNLKNLSKCLSLPTYVSSQKFSKTRDVRIPSNVGSNWELNGRGFYLSIRFPSTKIGVKYLPLWFRVYSNSLKGFSVSVIPSQSHIWVRQTEVYRLRVRNEVSD